MSMLLLTLTAAATVAGTPPYPGASGRDRCGPPTALRVSGPERVRIRPLGDMPPARQYLGVLRTLDHCPVPAVVREEVGQPLRPRR